VLFVGSKEEGDSVYWCDAYDARLCMDCFETATLSQISKLKNTTFLHKFYKFTVQNIFIIKY
jgi:hypothetical protein